MWLNSLQNTGKDHEQEKTPGATFFRRWSRLKSEGANYLHGVVEVATREVLHCIWGLDPSGF